MRFPGRGRGRMGEGLQVNHPLTRGKLVNHAQLEHTREAPLPGACKLGAGPKLKLKAPLGGGEPGRVAGGEGPARRV